MTTYLAFEKPVEALVASAAQLRASGGHEAEAAMLDERAQRQLADVYARLTPWQRTQVARHPARHILRIWWPGCSMTLWRWAVTAAMAMTARSLAGLPGSKGAG